MFNKSAVKEEPGRPVDASGEPAEDPTKNVLDIFRLEIRRQDDLREAKIALFDSKLKGLSDVFKAEVSALTEAINKSERVVAAASKQQAETLKAQIDSVMSGMSDVKERVGKCETQKQSADENRTSHRSDVGMLVGIAGLAVAVISVIFAILTRVT